MDLSRTQEQMELSVIDVNGKTYPVIVEESCTVDDFRDRILPAVLNLGPLHGNLVLSSGKRLVGKKTLKEEGVNHSGKLFNNVNSLRWSQNICNYEYLKFWDNLSQVIYTWSCVNLN